MEAVAGPGKTLVLARNGHKSVFAALVLSVGSDRIDTERLQLCFELEESTSARLTVRNLTRVRRVRRLLG